MLKQRRFLAEWIVFVLSVLAFLAFNASYAYWHGGASVGPRHLIPMIPYLAAAAVFTVSRHRGVSIFVIAVSACLLLMIVFGSHGSSDWRSNPIWHWVMDSVRGKTSGCKDGVFTTNVSISRDWNAFNLGELIRLPVTGPRRADSVISRHCQDTEVLLGLFLFVMLRWLRRLVKGAHGKQSEETA
jgi:hypothetical protein